jgi:hypothetical protein
MRSSIGKGRGTLAMMTPERSPLETEYRNVGTIDVRYEDVAQDGRPLLECVPPSLGCVWRKELANHPDAPKTQGLGIVPILTRIEVALGEDSFSPMQRFDVEGRAGMLAATNAEDGYKRALLDIETIVYGKTSHALLPRTGPSERREVGRIRAEHVLTKLFAKKDERRVTPEDVRAAGVRLDGARVWSRPQQIVEAPDGVTAIDGDFVRDTVPLAMGLMHTDSNQHVNSLVYPRLFEEAVMRRLHSLGRSRAVLSRALSIGWRRPSFAGDVLHVEMRLFEKGARLVACGMFFGENERDRARARCYVRVDLAP